MYRQFSANRAKIDAIIFDQWGILYDGSCAYAGAIDCLVGLAEAVYSLSVLSNSGKRAAPNAMRIAAMGFFKWAVRSNYDQWQSVMA